MWTGTVRKTREHCQSMPTADRLLNLLTLFTTRPRWSAEELATRLEITERTVRRDVTRLREIGYPIESGTGTHGGYQLGAGGKLPPLLLDDDEAVAMAIGLGATVGSEGLADAAVSALAKLDRVLPPRLRERVAAVRQVTLGMRRAGLPAFDTAALVQVAVACRRPERLRFDYRDGSDQESHRHVEPFRLVFTDRRWYLVAYDTGREAWRTFRVDRMSSLHSTGIPFTRGEVPDALALVSEGVAVLSYEMFATVRIHEPRREVEQFLSPMVGVIDHEDEDGTVVRIGGDAAWIARHLAGWEYRYEVLDPPEVRDALRALGQRLVRDHPRRRAGA